MKILNNEQGKNWLRDNHLPIEKSEFKNLYKESLVYLLDPDSGKKTALARGLRNFIEEDRNEKEGLFWITQTEVWPSSENPNLFNAYRKSLNETRSLQEAPFHVFNKNEMNDLECLLDISLFFFWDAILISPNSKFVIIPNHDEQIGIFCKEKSDIGRFKEFFDLMKFKESKH